MSSESKTVHVIVKGSVQGVGFRATVKRVADKCFLVGSVKNLSDGTVEIYVQGSQENIDTFIQEVQKSKGLAKISHLSAEPYESSRLYSSFEIIF